MESIWDEPAMASSAPLFRDSGDDGRPPAPIPAAEPLFLEDTDNPAPRHQKEGLGHVDDDMEDLFAGFDDIVPPTEPLNVDALMQKARARLDAEKRASNASGATTGQSGEAEKDRKGPKSKNGTGKDDVDQKSRRVTAKVDDERLLGDRGFPALIKEAKRFKPKGKGHEAADLDRLMDLYQLWAHKMFPKTQFRDTTERVERVCRQKRMLVNLSRWRAEAQLADEDQGTPVDLDSDDEVGISRHIDTQQNPAVSVNDNQPAPARPLTAPRVRVIDADDTDIWEEMENREPASALTQEQDQANNEPGDFEDWFALDEAPVPSSTSREATSVPNAEPLDFGEHGTNAITDDEIDALFAHMDEAMIGAAPRQPLPTEDDFEDMYN